MTVNSYRPLESLLPPYSVRREKRTNPRISFVNNVLNVYFFITVRTTFDSLLPERWVWIRKTNRRLSTGETPSRWSNVFASFIFVSEVDPCWRSTHRLLQSHLTRFLLGTKLHSFNLSFHFQKSDFSFYFLYYKGQTSIQTLSEGRGLLQEGVSFLYNHAIFNKP